MIAMDCRVSLIQFFLCRGTEVMAEKIVWFGLLRDRRRVGKDKITQYKICVQQQCTFFTIIATKFYTEIFVFINTLSMYFVNLVKHFKFSVS